MCLHLASQAAREGELQLSFLEAHYAQENSGIAGDATDNLRKKDRQTPRTAVERCTSTHRTGGQCVAVFFLRASWSTAPVKGYGKWAVQLPPHLVKTATLSADASQ